MKWRPSGVPSIQVGGKCVPVRTLRVRGQLGQLHRFRVRTVYLGQRREKSTSPCWGQLARDEHELIGVLVIGAHRTGQVRVGPRAVVPYLFVSLDAVSKAVRKRLLIPVDYAMVVEDEVMLAREKHPSPWYVASCGSHLFHEPGCPAAQRVREENRIVFQTKEEAFTAGFHAHETCVA